MTHPDLLPHSTHGPSSVGISDGEAEPLLQSAARGGGQLCARPVETSRRAAQLDLRHVVADDEQLQRQAAGRSQARRHTAQTAQRQSLRVQLVQRRGVVVSGVRRMNVVNARRVRLVPGWVTVFG